MTYFQHLLLGLSVPDLNTPRSFRFTLALVFPHQLINQPAQPVPCSTNQNQRGPASCQGSQNPSPELPTWHPVEETFTSAIVGLQEAAIHRPVQVGDEGG